MNEVGDGVELVGRSINEREGVGCFVTNGRHADGAVVEKSLDDARLFETDVLNAGQFDDVGRVRKKTRNGDLDGAFVGDEKFVAKVDFGTDKANKNN